MAVKKALTVAQKKRAATARANKLELNRKDRFCLEYVMSQNGTQSYLTAFPKIKNEATAATAAWRLLRNVEIQRTIKELRVTHHDLLVATHQEILQEVSGLALFDPENMFDEDGRLLQLHEMDPVTRKMVNEIEISLDDDNCGLRMAKIKYGKDKRGYIDMMMRHHAQYHDKGDNINNGVIIVQHAIPEDALL